MIRIAITNAAGQAVGAVEIPKKCLALERGQQALQETLVAFRASQRAGTAATLTKGQVAGSNRKPWAQKGLGRARAGYRRSPVWRGGSVVFGPQPRDYAKRVPRNVGRLAFRRALSEKIAGGAIRVLDELSLAEPKTKAILDLLASLQITGKVLIVLAKADRNLTLATRNLPKIEMALAGALHPYQLVNYPLLLTNRQGMLVLEQRLKQAAGEKQQ